MFYFTSDNLIKRIVIDNGLKLLCTPKRNLVSPFVRYPKYVGTEEFLDKKIICNNCGRTLIEYKTPVDREDKIFVNAYYYVYYKDGMPKIDRYLLNGLFAFEVREDGSLGLECSCGQDTRSITKSAVPVFGRDQEYKTEIIGGV